MTSSATLRPLVGQLELALENACAALLGLESLQGEDRTPRIDAVQAHLRVTIDGVRVAIAALRATSHTDAHPCALGFVLAGAARDQVNPRRTA